MSNIKKRLERLEATQSNVLSYVSFPTLEDYQAAGNVDAGKVYIGISPDDWDTPERTGDEQHQKTA